MKIRNNSSKSNSSAHTDDDIDSSIITRLRRLKIQENLLLKWDNGSACDYLDETENGNRGLRDTEKLKNSYIDIRDLFEEMKVNTSHLQNINIEEVKNNVRAIENKIKHLKSCLQTELKILTFDEQELNQQIAELSNDTSSCSSRHPVPVKPFLNVVPSPVKVMIDSPFRYAEVQEFQAFMSQSKNFYGGWILYNHEIFLRCWNKFFNMPRENNDLNEYLFKEFAYKVHKKLPEITIREIIDHCKWYEKYIYLKERQKIAIQKWKKKTGSFKRNSHLKTMAEVTKGTKVSYRHCKNRITDSPDLNFTQVSTENADSRKFKRDTDEKELMHFLSETFNEANAGVTMPLKHDNDNTLELGACSLWTPFEDTLITENEVKSLRKASDTRVYMPSYRNSTEQWINKCKSKNDCTSIQNMTNIDNITKLRTPDWRLGLKSDEVFTAQRD